MCLVANVVASQIPTQDMYAQAVAAQHQLQYQAAAMQAQAMQAAAANAAWNQGNNPYLSGLCFPYNLYSAAAPQQLYAAYARSATVFSFLICLSWVFSLAPGILNHVNLYQCEMRHATAYSFKQVYVKYLDV